MEGQIKLRLFIILLSLLIFSIGGIIYLTLRSESLIMFRWCEIIYIKEYVDNIRLPYILPNWIVFSLPDGLWVLSYKIGRAHV